MVLEYHSVTVHLSVVQVSKVYLSLFLYETNCRNTAFTWVLFPIGKYVSLI